MFLCPFLAWFIHWPLRWKRQVHPKCQLIFKGQRGALSNKIEPFNIIFVSAATDKILARIFPVNFTAATFKMCPNHRTNVIWEPFLLVKPVRTTRYAVLSEKLPQAHGESICTIMSWLYSVNYCINLYYLYEDHHLPSAGTINLSPGMERQQPW